MDASKPPQHVKLGVRAMAVGIRVLDTAFLSAQ